MPRLEATQRTTQRCQPGATVNAAESGPAVMTVAGGREQRSRRQPGSHPIQGQQEAMTADFSWEKSAKAYEEIYGWVTGK